MSKYCKKCGAIVESDDEFCRKCGEKVIQKSFFLDTRKRIIQSYYLALGSIAFCFIRHFLNDKNLKKKLLKGFFTLHQ